AREILSNVMEIPAFPYVGRVQFRRSPKIPRRRLTPQPTRGIVNMRSHAVGGASMEQAAPLMGGNEITSRCPLCTGPLVPLDDRYRCERCHFEFCAGCEAGTI